VSATDGGSYDASTHTITWTLSNVSAGTESNVQFTVKVLSGATTPGEVVNTASVKVGNDNAMQTNTVRNPVTKDTSEGGGTNPKNNPSSTNPSSTGKAKTGDVSTTYLWILLMVACALVVVAGVLRRTRRPGARK
ncbi:MAG: hypothetical protein LIO56_06010, partial [Lachnospiraceae bacterium]|nr:hypothetical protein [Lachnospiraceae bacterium]